MGPTSHSLGMKPVLTCETQLDPRSGWLPSLSLKCPSPLSKVLGTLFSVLIQWRLVAKKNYIAHVLMGEMTWVTHLSTVELSFL